MRVKVAGSWQPVVVAAEQVQPNEHINGAIWTAGWEKEEEEDDGAIC